MIAKKKYLKEEMETEDKKNSGKKYLKRKRMLQVKKEESEI